MTSHCADPQTSNWLGVSSCKIWETRTNGFDPQNEHKPGPDLNISENVNGNGELIRGQLNSLVSHWLSDPWDRCSNPGGGDINFNFFHDLMIVFYGSAAWHSKTNVTSFDNCSSSFFFNPTSHQRYRYSAVCTGDMCRLSQS